MSQSMSQSMSHCLDEALLAVVPGHGVEGLDPVVGIKVTRVAAVDVGDGGLDTGHDELVDGGGER